MKTLALDNNYNLILSNNNLSIIENIEACAQDTRTRLGIIKGEDPLNTEIGIDYFNEALGSYGGESYLINLIKNRIKANEEIISIYKIEFNFDNNILKIISYINSIYGIFSI